jgi:MFS family permease
VKGARYLSIVTAAHLLLLVSGGASLIDELLWARAVSSVLGGAHRTEALVLGVFFAAIPLGAALGARWVRDHDSAPALWRRYALCEGSTAISVVAPMALSRGFFVSGWPVEETQAATAVLLTLVVPGAAVGAAWPLLVAIVRARGEAIGTLYSLNTLGSAAGSLLAGFVLMEQLGVSGGLAVSGATSAVLAGAGLLLSRSDATSVPDGPPAETVSDAATDESLIWWVGSLTGFLTLAFEVLGARLLVLVVPTTVYTLALVLAVQLGGLAIGARLVPLLVTRGVAALPAVLAVATVLVAWAPFITSVGSGADPNVTTQQTLWGACSAASLGFFTKFTPCLSITTDKRAPNHLTQNFIIELS